jgi:hypothetical protein
LIGREDILKSSDQRRKVLGNGVPDHAYVNIKVDVYQVIPHIYDVQPRYLR